MLAKQTAQLEWASSIRHHHLELIVINIAGMVGVRFSDKFLRRKDS